MRRWLLAALVVTACSSESSSDLGPLKTGAANGDDDDDAAPAKTTDAGPSGGGTGCSGKSLKLCEDFDSSSAGSTPTGWTVLDGYSDDAPKTEVATDSYHSPPNALKTSSAITGAARVQKSLADLGATAGTHWGRIFFKVASPAPQLTSQGPHVTFVALEGNLRAGELRVVDTQQDTSGKIQLLANTPDDNCCTGTDFIYPLYDGNWHCSEWYVDQATQSYRAFLDGAEIKDLAFDYGAGSTKANMPTAFTTVAVGAIFYTPKLPSALTTWFDDLAIDDHQIGCN